MANKLKRVKLWLCSLFRNHKHETVLAKFEEVLLGQLVIKEDLTNIKQKIKDMPENVSELKAALDTLASQVTDIGNALVETITKQTEGFDEVTKLIADLQGGGKIPADAQESFNVLVAKLSSLQASANENLATAKKIADIVPNPPPVVEG